IDLLAGRLSREITEKNADRGDPAGNGFRRLAGAALAMDEVEVIVGGGVGEGSAALAEAIFQQLQVAAIGVECVLRQPALGCKVQEEITQQRAAAARVEWPALARLPRLRLHRPKFG